MARYRHRSSSNAACGALPLDAEARLWLARACLVLLHHDLDEDDIPRVLARVLAD